ncbi:MULTISPECIES: GNAT family N-acetyltransferase [Gordonibacter]|uniref:GNAT family N-acetyltransferase n=1 Tax=Gordonibacter faecis TaxID=3047475 RepID=A0ABT7DRC5_9ACTN|nr:MULTISPECIES: GNAT family N-acetyltransferase [unclassified Gordonibacter]MDJ1650720.1 GNAT family N-acetyltransferase [Gordonibacter sp. KGMB12511]HIW77497.1 GNAT family N-acetyltransferase [Candidatus Gordonibacter avicola]
MEPILLRLATDDDATDIRAVYEPYLATPITFETELPSLKEFRARMVDARATYPYLVAERAGEIVGYAYASAQHPRAAYAWNVELSVYLALDARGRGLGRVLYEALIELVRTQGAKAAYALVTVPNAASEGLHAALGFERIGLQPHAGWKAGAWHDVAWLRKELAPYEGAPEPLVPFPELLREQPDVVRAVLERANAALRG